MERPYQRAALICATGERKSPEGWCTVTIGLMIAVLKTMDCASQPKRSPH